MSLKRGRKPEHQMETDACTGKTCKLYTERPNNDDDYYDDGDDYLDFSFPQIHTATFHVASNMKQCEG